MTVSYFYLFDPRDRTWYRGDEYKMWVEFPAKARVYKSFEEAHKSREAVERVWKTTLRIARQDLELVLEMRP